ncbi:3-hydroxyisobutyryl-CoA hydrolase [Ruicaihuangia caeni]|uniref:3-hydroxyisobutyryl-CoA hydrolase n=1 Tax=Ruicaihuangia caeni TaxID=3042517 RepID=UPI00338FBB5B
MSVADLSTPGEALGDAPVIVRTEGRLGRITLNRPRALNAIDHEMVLAMAAALAEWSTDDSVSAVLLDGAGKRGLCAGGDLHKNGDAPLTPAFLRDEYHLNLQIAEFPKPFIALMDGIVMGGGIGVSAHASHRIVTERSKLAMPETRIGMVPDVGGSLLLNAAPGAIGRHLGLTSGQFDGADAIACGFADTTVASTHLVQLVEAVLIALDELDEPADAVAAAAAIDAAVANYAAPVPESTLMAQQHWIDRCYASDSVPQIVEALRESARGDGGQDAEAAASAILAVSPTAAVATLELLRRTQGVDLREALELEYRAMTALAEMPDAREGVRALLVDRDTPRWSPAALEDVDADQVRALFERPAADGPLF